MGEQKQILPHNEGDEWHMHVRRVHNAGADALADEGRQISEDKLWWNAEAMNTCKKFLEDGVAWGLRVESDGSYRRGSMGLGVVIRTQMAEEEPCRQIACTAAAPASAKHASSMLAEVRAAELALMLQELLRRLEDGSGYSWPSG